MAGAAHPTMAGLVEAETAGLGPARKHSKFDVDTPGEAAEAGCKAGRKGKIFGERMELRDIASFEIVAQGKSAATAAMLLGALRGHFVFEKVDDVHAEEVVAAMSRVDLEEEELLFHRRDASEHFYVVESGSLVAIDAQSEERCVFGAGGHRFTFSS